MDEVKRALSGSGVAIEMEGAADARGRVVSQEPDPGTILVEDTARVRIRFAPGA